MKPEDNVKGLEKFYRELAKKYHLITADDQVRADKTGVTISLDDAFHQSDANMKLMIVHYIKQMHRKLFLSQDGTNDAVMGTTQIFLPIDRMQEINSNWQATVATALNSLIWELMERTSQLVKYSQPGDSRKRLEKYCECLRSELQNTQTNDGLSGAIKLLKSHLKNIDLLLSNSKRTPEEIKELHDGVDHYVQSQTQKTDLSMYIWGQKHALQTDEQRLEAAIQDNDAEAISGLLNDPNFNFEVNWTDDNENTALMVAVCNNAVELVEQLLSLSIKPDTDRQNKEGDTALMVAVRNNAVGLVEQLLSLPRKPDTERQNKEGDTALIIASKTNNKQIAGILLDSGLRRETATYQKAVKAAASEEMKEFFAAYDTFAERLKRVKYKTGDSKIIEEYICPVSLEVMTNPITLARSGHTYDESSVKGLIAKAEKQHATTFPDPKTRALIEVESAKSTKISFLLKNIIEQEVVRLETEYKKQQEKAMQQTSSASSSSSSQASSSSSSAEEKEKTPPSSSPSSSSQASSSRSSSSSSAEAKAKTPPPSSPSSSSSSSTDNNRTITTSTSSFTEYKQRAHNNPESSSASAASARGEVEHMQLRIVPRSPYTSPPSSTVIEPNENEICIFIGVNKDLRWKAKMPSGEILAGRVMTLSRKANPPPEIDDSKENPAIIDISEGERGTLKNKIIGNEEVSLSDKILLRNAVERAIQEITPSITKSM